MKPVHGVALLGAGMVEAQSRIDLTSGWLIQSSAKVAEAPAVVSRAGYQPRQWYATSVPSTVVAALVNPAKHPTVKDKDGQAFVDWLISPKGQETIAGYKVGGEQLFFPNASH